MTEQAKEYVGVIENRTEAMRQLTEELFSYSVVTTASQYRKEEEVLLGEILEDSIASMYGALVEKNIHLEVRMPEKKIRVKANRSGLMRVFGNIINNALKYSDGDLLIRLEEDGEVSFPTMPGSLTKWRQEIISEILHGAEWKGIHRSWTFDCTGFGGTDGRKDLDQEGRGVVYHKNLVAGSCKKRVNRL